MNKSCLALLLACACGGAANALDREQQHGKELLDTLCARCHAVGETGRSPHIDAPPFRNFGDRKLYDEDFSQRLQNGLSTIHPDMPLSGSIGAMPRPRSITSRRFSSEASRNSRKACGIRYLTTNPQVPGRPEDSDLTSGRPQVLLRPISC
jgi:cytochrome c5